MLEAIGIAVVVGGVAVGVFTFTLIALEKGKLWADYELAAIIPMIFWSAVAAIIAAAVTLWLFLA